MHAGTLPDPISQPELQRIPAAMFAINYQESR
jgi:hypothetical protein